ncbi:MAG TPA: PAS domain S-box protein [Ktedonobacterales bacterium]
METENPARHAASAKAHSGGLHRSDGHDEATRPSPASSRPPSGLATTRARKPSDKRPDKGPDRRFRATVERMPVGIAHVSADGRWLWVNQRLCDILGYSREDLLARPFEAIAYAPDLEANSASAQRMLAGELESDSIETRCIRHDGTHVWTALSISLARGSGGAPDYFIASVQDIDERKQLEDEARAMQALTDVALTHLSLDELLWALLSRISAVMRVENVVILLLDGDELTVRAARGLEEEVTANVRVPVGQGFSGRIAATRAPLIVDDLTNFPVVSPTLREKLRSVVGVPLLANGQLIGVVYVGAAQSHRFTERDIRVLQVVADRIALAIDHARLFDLTRHATNDAYVRAGELEAIFGTVADALVVYDLDGRVAQANVAFDELMARVMESTLHSDTLAARIQNNPFRDISGEPIPMEQLPQSRVLHGEALTGGNAGSFAVRALDGQEVYLSVTGAPLLDAEGHIVGAVCTFRDVTEWRKAEEERTQMLSMVSHELRTPLTSIKAYTQVVRRRLERAGNPEAEHLAKAEIDINLLTRLVDDLLDATRLETGKLELELTTFDLRALSDEVVQRQRQATGREICLSLPSVPVEVRGDVIRVAQILTNLLTNALKYSAAQTPVAVSLERQASAARVVVRDQGSGIPPDQVPHLFERFYRVPGLRVQSGSGVGLGLGLYISKSLVERQGGQIGVESAVGRGSTFWFTLPLAQSAAPAE